MGKNPSVGELLLLKELFCYKFVTKNFRFKKALDMGCGQGFGTNEIAGSSSLAIGIDIDAKLLACDREMFGSKKCHFLLYDGSRIPFNDDTFDLVTCFQVIEHIKDDSGILVEIHRVLKPNGHMVLTTPNGFVRLGRDNRLWNAEHFREYDYKGLEDLLSIAGFTQINILGLDFKPVFKKIELARIRRNRLLARIDFFGIRKLKSGFITNTLRGILKTGRVEMNPEILERLKKLSHLNAFYITKKTKFPLDFLVTCKK